MMRLATLLVMGSIVGCGDSAPPPPPATTQSIDPQAVAKLRTLVVALLARPGLMIVSVGDAPPRTMALTLSGSDPSLAGTALVSRDETIVERKVQLAFSPASDSEEPTLRCTLGPLTSPAILPPASSETLTFAASINGLGQLVLSTPDDLVLRADPAANAAFVKHYATIADLQRRTIAVLHADLGAVTFCDADGKRAALIRVPDKDAYDLARFDGPDAALLPTAARTRYAVALRDGDASLVNAATSTTLVRVGDAIVSNTAGIEHRMTITRSLNADDLAKAQAAAGATLAQLRIAPAHFAATKPTDSPARVELGCDDGPRATGTLTDAAGHAEPILGTFTSSLVGLVVQFSVASKPSDSYRAAVDVVDGQLTLTGLNRPLRMKASR